MAETDRLAPEKIIEKKHAEMAFKYIRDNGQQQWDIWYYKTRPRRTKNIWVVELDGKEYYHREALKLSYLFALREIGEITNEEPPFLVAHKKYIIYPWREMNPMRSIWNGIGFDPQESKNAAGSEYSGEHQTVSNNIVDVGFNLLLQFYQIIFHGPPGTGKTYSAKKVLESLFEVNEEELCEMQGENWNIIQFHPSYNYEDFVRGIKVETEDNKIMYKTVNRIFGEMCKTAANNPDESYALIIDEINRANVSAVLGELIYALEYRGESIDTPYAIDEGENKSAELTIPENLYIIGTMNAADRTIGQIDYAVRRRFTFVHCPPNGKLILDDGIRHIFSKVAVLFISKKYLSQDFDGADVQVGHSYFLSNESQETLVRKQISLKIQYQVVPILLEYVKDGVLLNNDLTIDAIDEINTLAKNLLHAPENEKRVVNDDVAEDDVAEEENSSSSGKKYFYWRSDNSERHGISGVGRVAFSVIKDFIQHHPEMEVGDINNAIRSENLTLNFVRDKQGRDEFSDIISHQGKDLFVYKQWGATNNPAPRWNGLRKKMINAHGYSIGDCHLVNLGEDNGDNPSRTWEDCFKYKIVSARGDGYPASVKNLKKGDLLFVRLAEPSEGKAGYIACAEVEEEITHIEKVQTDKGELLAETVLDDGQKYREKYKSAFDKEYPDYAVKVRWLGNKSRSGVVLGISTPVLKFRVGIIKNKDISILREAFNIPSSDK